MSTLLAVGSDGSRSSASEDLPVITQIKKWVNDKSFGGADIKIIVLGNNKYRVNAWERISGGFCTTNRIRQSWYLNVVDGVIIDMTIRRRR